MNITQIEPYSLPASSCILRKTRGTPLLMWACDARFYFVQMKCRTVGRKIALQSMRAAVHEMSFHLLSRGCENHFLRARG